MPNAVLLRENGGGSFSLNSASSPVFAPTTLAVGAAYFSGVKDLGATFARQYRVRLDWAFTTAPTAQRFVEVYAVRCNDASGSKHDGDVNIPGLTGTAGDRYTAQFIGVITVRATNGMQSGHTSDLFYPQGQFNAFGVYNDTNQTFLSTATAHVLTLSPILDEIQ